MQDDKNRIYYYTSKGQKNADNTYNLIGYYSSDDKCVRINKFIIPYSFYNINSYNNVLKTSAGNITVPIGFYDIDTLTTEIQTLLKALDITFTCTYSDLTGKITIARTTNFTLTLSSSTINNVLGFEYVDKTGAATYTADNCYNIQNCDFITFHSKNMSKINFNSVSDGRNYFVCSIPVGVLSTDKIIYEPDYPIIFQIEKIKSCLSDIIYFMDEDGNIINFNGLNFKIELEILRV